MRINGYWHDTESGVVLPVVDVELQAADGAWRQFQFLRDTGAELSVLRYEDLIELGVEVEPTTDHLTGVGGDSGCVRVAGPIRLLRDDGQSVTIHGGVLALTDPIALDLSVLGRDILGHFAVIVDKPKRVVAILHGQHDYDIVTR